MTHPDILEKESKGDIRAEAKTVYRCCVCNCGIYMGDSYYETEGDDIVCDDCDLEYMKRFRRVVA